MAERGRGREREGEGGERERRGREREMVISLQGPLRKAGRSLTWSFLINPATVTPPVANTPPSSAPPAEKGCSQGDT